MDKKRDELVNQMIDDKIEKLISEKIDKMKKKMVEENIDVKKIDDKIKKVRKAIIDDTINVDIKKFRQEKTEEMIVKMIAKMKLLAKDNISAVESSHCFGPDEEYKLRKIMNKIGLTKISEAFGQIAIALEDKKNKSLYGRVSEKMSKIISSITAKLSNHAAKITPKTD